MKYDVVIFDWDGTLVDSEQHIVASIAQAAKATGLEPLPYEQMKDIIGLGMREALAKLYPGLSSQQVEAMRQHYAGAFFSKEMDRSMLFDGVEETLGSLRRDCFRMAVATGKSRNGLEKALDATALRSYFAQSRCADETRSKPDPAMLQELQKFFDVPVERMLMVGDTEYDLAMAKSMGMPAVGVSYGVHDINRLYQQRPLEIVDQIGDILHLV